MTSLAIFSIIASASDLPTTGLLLYVVVVVVDNYQPFAVKSLLTSTVTPVVFSPAPSIVSRNHTDTTTPVLFFTLPLTYINPHTILFCTRQLCIYLHKA
jgi:hypothetical protein